METHSQIIKKCVKKLSNRISDNRLKIRMTNNVQDIYQAETLKRINFKSLRIFFSSPLPYRYKLILHSDARLNLVCNQVKMRNSYKQRTKKRKMKTEKKKLNTRNSALS